MDALRIIRADLDDPEHQAAVLEMTRDYARDPMGNGCDLSDDVQEVLIQRSNGSARILPPESSLPLTGRSPLAL